MRGDRFNVVSTDSVCDPAAPRNALQTHYVIKELERNQAGVVLMVLRVSAVMRYNSATLRTHNLFSISVNTMALFIGTS